MVVANRTPGTDEITDVKFSANHEWILDSANDLYSVGGDSLLQRPRLEANTLRSTSSMPRPFRSAISSLTALNCKLKLLPLTYRQGWKILSQTLTHIQGVNTPLFKRSLAKVTVSRPTRTTSGSSPWTLAQPNVTPRSSSISRHSRKIPWSGV